MRAALEKLVEDVSGLPETDFSFVVAEASQRRAKLRMIPKEDDQTPWPPAFFASGRAARSDISQCVDELLAEGFGTRR